MHVPLFPPVLEDWTPCDFPKPPIPYWMLNTDLTKERLREKWAKPLAQGWATKMIGLRLTKKQLDRAADVLVEGMLK